MSVSCVKHLIITNFIHKRYEATVPGELTTSSMRARTENSVKHSVDEAASHLEGPTKIATRDQSL